jgi:phytanoyl-CoA hydroxylase
MNIERFSVYAHQDVIDYYNENGFVVIENFFERSLLRDFKNDVENIIEAHFKKAKLSKATDDYLTQGILQLENVDHDFVASVYDTIHQSPSFYRICGYKKTSQLINMLLEKSIENALYGFTNRCRIDPPNDNRRTYDWHQEVFYTIPKSRFIQTWAPLIFDTTIQNGTIEVIPKSHRNGTLPQTWNEFEDRATQIIVTPEAIKGFIKTPLEMRVGEMLLFSPCLVHRSGNNLSDQVRYSLVGMYHDVTNPSFMAPKSNFIYRNGSPKEYFEDFFNTEKKEM